jgi:DNA-directed RNA polymerase subunit RPC12/RpoP
MSLKPRELPCQHCGRTFDPAETTSTFDGTTARYVCPDCGCGTTGPLLTR